MKFYFFHLMPYQDIDSDFLEHNKSSWITLPNSYYDPKKGAKLYHRYLDELELADQTFVGVIFRLFIVEQLVDFLQICCNIHCLQPVD